MDPVVTTSAPVSGGGYSYSDKTYFAKQALCNAMLAEIRNPLSVECGLAHVFHDGRNFGLRRPDRDRERDVRFVRDGNRLSRRGGIRSRVWWAKLRRVERERAAAKRELGRVRADPTRYRWMDGDRLRGRTRDGNSGTPTPPLVVRIARRFPFRFMPDRSARRRAAYMPEWRRP